MDKVVFFILLTGIAGFAYFSWRWYKDKKSDSPPIKAFGEGDGDGGADGGPGEETPPPPPPPPPGP